ncbi:MAG: hypothetical protein WC606_00245 [Candidatus Absconditabacterales bacterium]
MTTKHISKKNNYLCAIIACIGLFFSGIFIIRAFNESKFYDGISGNISIDANTALGQKIVNIQGTLQAHEAIKQQEYEKALQLISGNKSEDYYNRGTIETLLAYKNALQSSISGLENAQIFVDQAQQSFDIAKKLSTSTVITKAIIDNQNTIHALSSVVDIKTCYGVGQTIIIGINDIISTIKNIKTILDQEDIYINKRMNSLDATCYEKLRSILDNSREQVGLLQLQMEKNNTKYISDFSDKIDNPMICIQIPYENIIPSTIKGKQGLEEYQMQHINTIEALKNNDSKSIQELCNQSKNDAQVNQQIENSVQELLQKLDENKIENQQQKRISNEVKYKDFFNENEKKVLQEIKTTNQGRIDTILNIRGKGNYNPEQYINDMFNQFYGNSGDFINLHK